MSGQKGVLIISALDYWSMGEGKGVTSLWQSLKGYDDRDCAVHLIVSESEGESEGR